MLIGSDFGERTNACHSVFGKVELERVQDTDFPFLQQNDKGTTHTFSVHSVRTRVGY